MNPDADFKNIYDYVRVSLVPRRAAVSISAGATNPDH